MWSECGSHMVESAGHGLSLPWLQWVCFYIVGALNLTSYVTFKYVCVFAGKSGGCSSLATSADNSRWTINLNKSPRLENARQRLARCKSRGTFFSPCNLFEA
jgi:hypothetical protein